MASIKKACTLVKRGYLSNLSANDGLALTIMLNGPHGIGKTQIVKSAAKDLGGICLTMDGSVLKEGDAVGIPFPFKDEQGIQEVRFIKNHVISKIWRLEKYYYEKACSEGLLNGKYKLIIDKDNNEYLVVNNEEPRLVRDFLTKIEEGEDNAYKLNGLTPDEKRELINAGEIKPVILFIDEMNRAEMQTAKELMNIVLNRTVNGYDLPFFVNIVAAVNPSSQNSSYATTEFDPAQYSRFCNIKVSAKLEDWIDYAAENDLNVDVMSGVSVSEQIFTQKDSSTEDTTEMTPDPRAWEMVAHLFDSVFEDNKSKFFTDDERKEVNEDLRTLVIGKVGRTAATQLFSNIENKENNIKPEEILTLDSRHIHENVVAKFNRQKKLTQIVITQNLVNYLVAHINEYEKFKVSSDAKQKEKYMNFCEQLKEYTNLLDTATQILFVKKLLKVEKGQVFGKVAKCFCAEVLMSIQEAKSALKDLQNK